MTMKRTAGLLLSACLASGSVLASGERQPEYRDLALIAANLAEDFDARVHAEDWLELYLPRLARAREAGELSEAEALEKAATDLREAVAAVDVEQPLVLEPRAFFREYDPDREAFELEDLFSNGFIMANQPWATQLPLSFLVLIVNPEVVAWLPVPEDEKDEFLAQRQRLPGAGKRRLYARVELEFVGLKNDSDLQAVIRRAEIFADREHETLLKTFEETRDPDRLVAESLLSEGVTWQLQENHGFHFRGIRLLDVLPGRAAQQWLCREDGREAGHRVVACFQELRLGGEPVQLERRYLGGRLARMVVRPVGDGPSEGESLRKLRRQLQSSLRQIGRPGPASDREPEVWEYAGARLWFEPDRLAQIEEPVEPFLIIDAIPYRELTGKGPAS